MLEALVGLSPIVSAFVSWFVYYKRAGLADTKSRAKADWREFFIPNAPWFLLTLGKCVIWPAVLVAWLVQGRPASPWQAVTELNGRPARAIIRVGAEQHERR